MAEKGDFLAPPNESSRLVSKGPEKEVVSGAPKAPMIVVYCVMLFVTGIGNSIFFKKMTLSLNNYPYFLSQFTTIVYVPIFFLLVLYQLLFTKRITKEMRQLPKNKFFFMGVFDSLSGLIGMFGSVKTSGTLQVLLNNSVVPITMFLSVIILGTHFKAREYLGSVVILCGVLIVVVVPALLSDPESDSGSPQPRNEIYFNVIYFFSVVPSALSAIYKEKLFTNIDLEVNYLQAWVAVWQLLFGFAMIPLNTFKFLGDNYMPYSQLPHALIDGAMCFFGHNTVVEHCATPGTNSATMLSLRLCDQCEGAWLVTSIYLTFNVLYNICLVLIIKHGSAALLFVVSTLSLPVVQILFSIRYINDPPDRLSFASILGLVLIVSGLTIYNRSDREAPLAGEEDVVVPMAGRPFAGGVIRRNIMTHLRKDAAQLRGGYYGRLGVIGSPSTPNNYLVRGSPHLSPMPKPVPPTPGRRGLQYSGSEVFMPSP